MILLENCVPPVYVEESRDFQFFLRAYNVVFNMVKQDTDTLQYLTNTKECETRILPLLKTKLGFFTNYDMDDTMLRWILRGFPYMVKNKGSLESIRQAVYTFLKALNIKTKIIIKAIGAEEETVEGSINVGDHTILIAIESAVQNFYVLEELFRYIMPIGYQYNFYFYKKIETETWLLNKHTGKYVIISNDINDSIRARNIYNQNPWLEYYDPEVDRLINQVDLSNVNNGVMEVEPDPYIETHEFTMRQLDYEEAPDWFDDYCLYLYQIVDGKYVQVTVNDDLTYQPGKFYIPVFLFVNEENMYEELTEDPIYQKTGESDLLYNYFNYYELENGKFRNLQNPVAYEAGKYYKPKDANWSAGNYMVSASDVSSYAAIPLTSQYISISAGIAQ